MHKNSWLLKNNLSDSFEDSFTLIMIFKLTTVLESTETYVYDFETMMTALGGNLGLFLGTSCLSILFEMIQCLAKIFKLKM